MATNLHINEALLAKAVKLGGGRSKRETVNNALAEYIRKREAEGLIALFGSIDYDPSYNYKEQRKLSTRKGLTKARGKA